MGKRKPYTAARAMRDAQPLIDKAMGRTKGSGCQCRNHLGKPKTQHKSRDDALTQIVRRHMRHGGGFSVYPCPTKPGTFHVTTERKQQR